MNRDELIRMVRALRGGQTCEPTVFAAWSVLAPALDAKARELEAAKKKLEAARRLLEVARVADRPWQHKFAVEVDAWLADAAAPAQEPATEPTVGLCEVCGAPIPCAWWTLHAPTTPSPPAEPPVTLAQRLAEAEPIIREQCRKRAAAIRVLLDSWVNDDSGYDERVWPQLAHELGLDGKTEPSARYVTAEQVLDVVVEALWCLGGTDSEIVGKLRAKLGLPPEPR